jgi:hypothetical protein
MNLVKTPLWKNMLFGALLATGIAAMPGGADAALGVDFSKNIPYENGGVLGTSSEPYTIVGWSFTPTRDLYLNGLALWDQDVEKRHSESHQIGLWDASQNLLASVTVSEPAGSSHNVISGSYGAQYHVASLNAPLLLTKGTVYYVGATLFAQAIGTNLDFDAMGSFDAGQASLYNFTVNSDIAFLSNAYGTSSSNQLLFPDHTDSLSTYLFGANIDVVPTPVPAAAWLLGSGLLGMIGLKRRMVKS